MTIPAIAPAFSSVFDTVLDTVLDRGPLDKGGVDIEVWTGKTGGSVTASAVPQHSLVAPQHQVLLSGGQGVIFVLPLASLSPLRKIISTVEMKVKDSLGNSSVID